MQLSNQCQREVLNKLNGHPVEESLGSHLFCAFCIIQTPSQTAMTYLPSLVMYVFLSSVILYVVKSWRCLLYAVLFPPLVITTSLQQSRS